MGKSQNDMFFIIAKTRTHRSWISNDGAQHEVLGIVNQEVEDSLSSRINDDWCLQCVWLVCSSLEKTRTSS